MEACEKTEVIHWLIWKLFLWALIRASCEMALKLCESFYWSFIRENWRNLSYLNNAVSGAVVLKANFFESRTIDFKNNSWNSSDLTWKRSTNSSINLCYKVWSSLIFLLSLFNLYFLQFFPRTTQTFFIFFSFSTRNKKFLFIIKFSLF